MFGRKKHFPPCDLTGWSFDVVNYPAGSKKYQATITGPDGHEVMTHLGYGCWLPTVFIKAKTPEIALDKAKQVVYDIVGKDNLSKANSTNVKF